LAAEESRAEHKLEKRENEEAEEEEELQGGGDGEKGSIEKE
jgi:hypothetical protein